LKLFQINGNSSSSPPPVQRKVFISDAAGLPDGKMFSGNEGVGGIGFDEEGHIVSAFQFIWPEKFLNAVDRKGARMGSKTTTLEILGVLFHILLFPELLMGHQVVFQTDNMACYYGWENKAVKEDSTASIVIRTISILANFLNCNVHFDHVPRVSTWEARVVDRLSRKSTTTSYDKKLVESFGSMQLPVSLREWLNNSCDNWNLPLALLYDVKTIINNTK
jgi:hypothetical protein